jgi:quercetin dioxygenase-like cupin family protein
MFIFAKRAMKEKISFHYSMKNRCQKEIVDILEIEEINREIIKNNLFSVKYLYFEAGKGLPVQFEAAMATIQVIEGRITFVYGKDGENTCRMQGGTILEFDARETYSMIAHENSKVLITIVPIK